MLKQILHNVYWTGIITGCHLMGLQQQSPMPCQSTMGMGAASSVARQLAPNKRRRIERASMKLKMYLVILKTKI